MVNLNDEEARQIISAVEKVRDKFMDGSEITGEKLMLMHNELEGRINDLGYACTVDVTPLFEGMPPEVRIDERIDREDFMDPERKMWDITKRVERNEDAPDVEGHV